MKSIRYKPAWFYVGCCVVLMTTLVLVYVFAPIFFFPALITVATSIVSCFHSIKMEVDNRFSFHKVDPSDIANVINRYPRTTELDITQAIGRAPHTTGTDILKQSRLEAIQREHEETAKIANRLILAYTNYRELIVDHEERMCDYKAPSDFIHPLCLVYIVLLFIGTHWDRMVQVAGSELDQYRVFCILGACALYIATAFLTYNLVTKDFYYTEGKLSERYTKTPQIHFSSASKEDVCDWLENQPYRILPVLRCRHEFLRFRKTVTNWVKVGYGAIITLSVAVLLFS